MKLFSRHDSRKVVYEADVKTKKELVVEAVKGYANLRYADLQGADLRDIKNYSENHSVGIVLCVREYKKFTQKEKAFIFEFIATSTGSSPCWNKIKEDFGKTALSVFKKLKSVGWGEYYEEYKAMMEVEE